MRVSGQLHGELAAGPHQPIYNRETETSRCMDSCRGLHIAGLQRQQQGTLADHTSRVPVAGVLPPSAGDAVGEYKRDCTDQRQHTLPPPRRRGSVQSIASASRGAQPLTWGKYSELEHLLPAEPTAWHSRCK